MKRLNVLILDKDNRDVVSLTYHYCTLGHNVMFPAPGTPGWNNSPLWPRILLRTTHDPSVRHVDLCQPTTEELNAFGEDSFLIDELSAIVPYSRNDVTCELVDVREVGRQIDVWHSTPNATGILDGCMSVAGEFFPRAKWISSSMHHFDASLKGNPQNIVRFLPASYHAVGSDRNACNMYRHPFEAELLWAPARGDESSTNGFASLNHNFSLRHPNEYGMFVELNKRLVAAGKEPVVNYGGNVQARGADPKYSGKNGLTGKFETLSPRQALFKYSESKAIVHLKGYDWAGGVPTGCRIVGCPLVALRKYVHASGSSELLVHNETCLLADNVDQLLDHVYALDNDQQLRARLASNSVALNDVLFNDVYWNSWRSMLEHLR
jgi:hypothetical protein